MQSSRDSASATSASLYKRTGSAQTWGDPIATGVVSLEWEAVGARKKLLMYLQSARCELQIDSDYRREGGTVTSSPSDRMLSMCFNNNLTAVM
jgi:hypothetical protein